MGLEIFYHLHTPEAWNAARVRRTVEAARQYALALGFAEVDEVKRNDPGHPETMCVRRLPKDFPHTYLVAEAEEGWLFHTWPGVGCETAVFGLCRFPARINAEGRSVPFGWGAGWHYRRRCQTQYADMVSREHFLWCHLGVIDLLDFFQAKGCQVRVRDGGDYWKSRRVERLADRLQRMHSVMAALMGAIKDATEDVATLVTPIVSHPQFEHLEAQGEALLARRHRRKTTRKK